MALNKVSQRILDAVYSRLSATDGFNTSMVTQAAQYSLDSFIQIDWSTTSQNFMFGQMNPDLLEQTGIFKYPFSCLYIMESAQTGEEKFNQFSGNIRCIFEVYLSWRQIKGIQNFEKYPNCVEDVVFHVINRVENQNWGKPLVYNGGIQCKRGPLAFAGDNFRQRIGFSMMFQVHE